MKRQFRTIFNQIHKEIAPKLAEMRRVETNTASANLENNSEHYGGNFVASEPNVVHVPGEMADPSLDYLEKIVVRTSSHYREKEHLFFELIS